MRDEPLFIRFANGTVTTSDIANTVISTSKDEPSKEIAKESLNSLPNIDLFRKDFRSALKDLIDTGINQQFINYVNSYMKPSLTEFLEGSSVARTGETRWVSIKAKDAPWMEAVICYNLCIYIRLYGLNDIKQCPVCQKFFSHKGKYAKYCSDDCKGRFRK